MPEPAYRLGWERSTLTVASRLQSSPVTNARTFRARSSSRSHSLNFGHTTANALEKVTNYRRFRHGEPSVTESWSRASFKKSRHAPVPRVRMLRHAVALCGALPRADDLALTQSLMR